MIIKQNTAQSASKILSYNYEKVQSFEDGVQQARVIGANIDGYSNKVSASRSLRESGNLNQYKLLKNRYDHIKVSLHPNDLESLTDFKFHQIGKEVLRGLDYSIENNPYIAFRHEDTEHPHIHIVVSRTTDQGKTVSDSYNGYRAIAVARKLESKYDLVVASSRRLNKQGVRHSKFYEAKKEKAFGVQSARQQVRDVITNALENNETFVGFANELQGSNVEIRFRVEKKDNEDTLVGLSYGLNGTKEKALKIAPKLSLNLPVENSDSIISQLIEQGYAKEAENKFYFDAGNVVRSNQNPFPVEPTKDHAFRAKDIGPGAEWYLLSEKFNDCTFDLVKDLLVEDNLEEKKSNVWIVKGEDVIPKLSPLELLASLGLKQNNLGFLYEAVNEGFDFDALYEKFENKDQTLIKRMGEVGMEHLGDSRTFIEGYLKSLPIIQERLKAISDLELPKETAMAYAVEEVSERSLQVINMLAVKANNKEEAIEQATSVELTDDLIGPSQSPEKTDEDIASLLEIEDAIQEENNNHEILDRDLWLQSLIDHQDAVKFSRELVLEPGTTINEEEEQDRGKSLLDYFLEANEEKLREAALNPKTDFSEIKKYLDEDYFLENELPDAVLDIAEKRIAQEIKESYSGEPNPITAQVIEHALGEEGKIKEFRYWVHIEGVDFEGQNKHNTIKINDKRVLANVHKRIETDRLYLPKHIAKDNQRLADALKENNVPRVMGFLDHPFVNFGDKRVDHIIEQLNKPENVEKLKTRVSQDEGRQIELLMLEKGNAVVNRETGEVVALDRKHKRKESNKNSEEQTTNMKQGFRKQKGNEGMSF